MMTTAEQKPSENPLVSVIVPNYNYARFLKQRIDTILNQTYQNFELIILDDCSTDNSKDIIESYRNNPHISHIVYNESNSGSTFKQWKKGFDLVKGDLVWIAEADDYSDKVFLEALIPSFIQGRNVGLVWCNSNVIDNEEGVINDDALRHLSFNWEVNGYFKGTDFIKIYLCRHAFPPNVSSGIFSSQIIKTIGNHLCYQNLKLCGDRMFYVLVSEQSDVVYINKKLNFFRRTGNSVTPKRIADGTVIRENFIVDAYLRDNHLLTGWNSLLTWCSRFSAIYYSEFESEQVRKDLLELYNPYGLMSRPLHRILSVLAIKMYRPL